jgi:dimeric dUTPase (all-alpha-NTP-PPase superfamily)
MNDLAEMIQDYKEFALQDSDPLRRIMEKYGLTFLKAVEFSKHVSDVPIDYKKPSRNSILRDFGRKILTEATKAK